MMKSLVYFATMELRNSSAIPPIKGTEQSRNRTRRKLLEFYFSASSATFQRD